MARINIEEMYGALKMGEIEHVKKLAQDSVNIISELPEQSKAREGAQSILTWVMDKAEFPNGVS